MTETPAKAKYPNIYGDYEHLPTLIIVSRHDYARELQRRFDPSRTIVRGMGAALMGYRVREIYIAISAWEDTQRFSEKAAIVSERAAIDGYHYLDQLRSRLAPGCADNYFYLY